MKILWATKIGEPDHAEQLITEQHDQIEPASKWAVENGFDRLRIADINMAEVPDFTNNLNI